MENNGDSLYGLNGEEVAALCASHTGTDEHVRIISRDAAKNGPSGGNAAVRYAYPAQQ